MTFQIKNKQKTIKFHGFKGDWPTCRFGIGMEGSNVSIMKMTTSSQVLSKIIIDEILDIVSNQ